MDCTYDTVENRTAYTRGYTHTSRTSLTDGGPGRGSIPRVGLEAARAAGQLPYPSRPRKISPPAFRRVLECASLWENCLASAGGQVRAEGRNRKYTQGPSRWNPRPSRRRPQLVVRRLTIHPTFIAIEEWQCHAVGLVSEWLVRVVDRRRQRVTTLPRRSRGPQPLTTRAG